MSIENTVIEDFVNKLRKCDDHKQQTKLVFENFDVVLHLIECGLKFKQLQMYFDAVDMILYDDKSTVKGIKPLPNP